ncbi:MAG: chitobiase/beta-hexosaminidase C-terminal domain-containing protein [Prevotella sp.]|nr:chitobiase/beta-hexosaminidase C-terminal domain-containing protein [Prevotella sp.]
MERNNLFKNVLLLSLFIITGGAESVIYADDDTDTDTSAYVSDVLTQTETGITVNAYSNFTYTAPSGNAYAGYVAGNYGSIQMKSTDSTSGIIVTTSIGYVRKIVIVWNSNTVSTTARDVDVYGKNTAYSSAADLYDSSARGTQIGEAEHTVTQGNTETTEITVTDGDYAYIGLRSKSGALYLDSITIYWQPAEGYVIAPTITPASGTYTEAQEVSITAGGGGEIYYAINADEDDPVYTQYTEPFTLSEFGMYVISAYAQDEDGNKSTVTTSTIELDIIGGLETFVNGSFEDWTDDNTPVGWVSSTTASSSGHISKSSDAEEGNYSVKIDHNDGSTNYRLASKEFILPGGTYKVTFYAKPANSEETVEIEGGYAPINEDGSMGNYRYKLKEEITGSEWTQETFSFTLAAETKLNLVVMNHSGEGYGEALVDNYTIKAMTDEFEIKAAEGYATYYTSNSFFMPDGTSGTTITDADSETGTLTMAWEYPAGKRVPEYTALLLRGAVGTYTYNIYDPDEEDLEEQEETDETDEPVGENLLHGSLEATETTGPDPTKTYMFYELSYNKQGEDFGFYWKEDNGAAFSSEGGKAWLAIESTASAAKLTGFSLDGGGTTGIQTVGVSTASADAIYNLQGIRVPDMSRKGIYIKGGRKFIVK